MTNEMHRPCVLPAKLKNVGILTLFEAEKAEDNDCNDPVIFDAFKFEGLKYEPSTSYAPEEYYLVKIYTRPNSVIVRYAPKKGIDVLVRQTNYLIQKALNPPIKVTQKVLAAMDKVPDAKFSASWGDLITWYRCYQAPLSGGALTWRASNGLRLTTYEEDYYVQADDCPLALQVLLQFNEEGERYA